MFGLNELLDATIPQSMQRPKAGRSVGAAGVPLAGKRSLDRFGQVQPQAIRTGGEGAAKQFGAAVASQPKQKAEGERIKAPRDAANAFACVECRRTIERHNNLPKLVGKSERMRTPTNVNLPHNQNRMMEANT